MKFKQGELGKYFIIFAPIIVAVWVLFPTYTARTLKNERDAIKKDTSLTESERAAKLTLWDEENGEDFADAKNSALKLGLDLEGGMYVTMEVDLIKLIRETASGDAIDDTFEEVLAKTSEEVKQTQGDAIDIFLKHFDNIARPQRTLFDYFELGDLSATDEQAIIDKLRQNSTEAVDQAVEVMGQRINKYKVSEPSITKQGNTRIVLEIPGVTNDEEVRSLLQTTARLDFKLVRNNADLMNVFRSIDRFLLAERGLLDEEPAPAAAPTDTTANPNDTTAAGTAAEDLAATDTSGAAQDSLVQDSAQLAADDSAKKPADTTNPYEGLSEEEALAKYRADYPFTSLFQAYAYVEGQQPQQIGFDAESYPDVSYFMHIMGDNVGQFQRILNRPEVQRLIPREYEILVSAKPDERTLTENNVEIFQIYGVKAEAELTGDVVVDARQDFDPQTGRPVVSMTMNAEGADRWARITGANVGKQVAIILDGRVYSAPSVINKITGGRSQITGSSSPKEAEVLAIVLKAGALKAPVEIVEERIVGPSLGADSIRSGVLASGAAFLLVLLFMALYYSTGGVIADVMVFVNLLLILTALTAFKGTLTLPGIAGLILTIGMAVDANILIYERIREELSRGRSIRAAVDEGYGKALSAILDSNITTFITGIILFYFGTGPVQGFAVTLMIGIVMTLFTALFGSRAIITLMLMRGVGTINLGQPKYAAN